MIHNKSHNIYLIILLILTCLRIDAQETRQFTLQEDGLTRTYYLYIPEMYDAETAVPLILNFHGYGSNALDQLNYGDFRAIADTAGFIIALPQGSLLEGISHFNVGGWTNASTVDDVKFTRNMLNEIALNYNIDNTRVYSTGMSNGGYMSFLLACQLSNKFAAIASVTGSMTPETYSGCVPIRPVPILQVHGTRDNVVPYEGDTWTHSIDEVLDFWIDHNDTDIDATVRSLEDKRADDGNTVETYLFANGTNGSEVLHYKVLNGGHTWPGSQFSSFGTNQDIDASAEIWEFFNQYDIYGLRSPIISSTFDVEDRSSVNIYPNPTTGAIHIASELGESLEGTIHDMAGKLILEFKGSEYQELGLEAGLYFISLQVGNAKIVKKLIVN